MCIPSLKLRWEKKRKYREREKKVRDKERMEKTILLKNKDKEERKGGGKQIFSFLNELYSSWEAIMFYTNLNSLGTWVTYRLRFMSQIFIFEIFV
jgi:hypothetical protein